MAAFRFKTTLVWFFLLLVAIVVAAGVAFVVTVTLASGPGPLARLSVGWPGNSSREIDQFVAGPLLTQLSQQGVKVVEVTSISGQEKCVIYVRGGNKVNATVLLAAVRQAADSAAEQLPVDSLRPQIEELPPESQIPKVQVQQEPHPQLIFNADRLAEMGLTLREARALVDKALPPDSTPSPETVAGRGLSQHYAIVLRPRLLTAVFSGHGGRPT